MKIITDKKQEKIDEMMIKKLRFVARATLEMAYPFTPKQELEKAMDRAEQVYWANNVISIKYDNK